MTVDIDCTIWCNADPSTYVNNDSYARKLYYEILKDDVTILSNKSVFDTNSEYDYKFTVGEAVLFAGVNWFPINARLEVKDILIDESGYLNIQLHPILEVTGGGPLQTDGPGT